MSVRVNKDGSGVDTNTPGATPSTHEIVDHVVTDELIGALAMYVRDQLNVIRQHAALALPALSVADITNGIKAKLKT
jgi:hypothetical protein